MVGEGWSSLLLLFFDDALHELHEEFSWRRGKQLKLPT
jgi:hypothetical protein